LKRSFRRGEGGWKEVSVWGGSRETSPSLKKGKIGTPEVGPKSGDR